MEEFNNFEDKELVKAASYVAWFSIFFIVLFIGMGAWLINYILIGDILFSIGLIGLLSTFMLFNIKKYEEDN